MTGTIEPAKVLVPTPQPVVDAAATLKEICDRYRRLVLFLFALLVIAVMGLAYVVMTNAEPAKERATDTIPIYTFESCETCQACEPETCPDCTWLSRFVGALDAEADTPLEIKDVLHRAYIESRFNEKAVSETGDWGICQINAKAHPEVDTQRLLVDPEYAASQCLDAYRVAVKACGKRWECCYRFGVKGCKNR